MSREMVKGSVVVVRTLESLVAGHSFALEEAVPHIGHSCKVRAAKYSSGIMKRHEYWNVCWATNKQVRDGSYHPAEFTLIMFDID